jgi:hypothetical protein
MGCEFMVLVVVLILLVVAVLTIKPHTESFDARGMGGQRYWGFSRPYGFNMLDQDVNNSKCYQVTDSDTCVPGFTRTLNLATTREECCGNYFNY